MRMLPAAQGCAAMRVYAIVLFGRTVRPKAGRANDVLRAGSLEWLADLCMLRPAHVRCGLVKTGVIHVCATHVSLPASKAWHITHAKLPGSMQQTPTKQRCRRLCMRTTFYEGMCGRDCAKCHVASPVAHAARSFLQLGDGHVTACTATPPCALVPGGQPRRLLVMEP